MTGIDLQKLEKLVNSELSSKILRSKIENNELLFETNSDDLIEVIQFLKSNDKCKFKQLIDIAGVDYPDNERRFQLIYLFLSRVNFSDVMGTKSRCGAYLIHTYSQAIFAPCCANHHHHHRHHYCKISNCLVLEKKNRNLSVQKKK